MNRLQLEANELTRGSIVFARSIDHATAGSRLGPIVENAMDARPEAFNHVRQAVHQRLDVLGGTGQELGLFMLAADMATTAELVKDMPAGDRQELRRLWDDLRSRS